MSEDEGQPGEPDRERDERADTAQAREKGKHYLFAAGCFGLVVLVVAAFYLWRMNG